LAWNFGGGASSSGIVVNPQTALQQATVFACVKVLAESIAMLPCMLYRKSGRDRAPAVDHQLYEVLRYQPNEWQTAVEFWEMMVASLCLRGNAYAWPNWTRSQQIAELLPLHPDMVNVTMGTGFKLKYQLTMPDGTFKDLGPGEIFHVRGLSLNGWLGISPIAYARESIGLALAAEKFGGQLFRNGAKMSGVLEHPTRISTEAYNRLKESFDAATSGENAHKTQILEENMKYSKISMTPDDAQFLETRKLQRSEIAAIYRVPAHLVNDLEKATFSNIEQQALQFVTMALMPWLTRIEQAVRRDLIKKPERASLEVAYDVSLMLRGDAAARSAYYHAAILDGWMTRNEARDIESRLGIVLNPIEGLDLPLAPLNMTDGTVKPEPATAPQAAPEPAAAPQADPAAAKMLEMLATIEDKVAMLRLMQPSPTTNVYADAPPITVNLTEEKSKRVNFDFNGNGEIVGANISSE
jgi:HK97 family phage portal protein